MRNVDKVVRDGKVAVLIAPSFGGGWSTWAGEEVSHQLLFEPEMVAWVEAGKKGPCPDMKVKYPGAYIPEQDVDDLIIKWIPVGTLFRVHEYDGSESIVVHSDEYWITA